MPKDNSPAPDEEEEEEYSVEKVVRLFFDIFLTDPKNVLLFDVLKCPFKKILQQIRNRCE